MDTTVIAGVFGLAGALGGVLLTNLTTKWSHDRSRSADDERRWLQDRRASFAAYLAIVEAMMREIDGVGVFLRYNADSGELSPDDDQLIRDGLFEYFTRWEDDLQPALGDVQLLASPNVADLADRVSGALMDVTGPIELRQTFGDYYPDWFRTRDLIVIMRNAMRVELGLPPAAPDAYPARRDPDWPWLPEQASGDAPTGGT